VRAINPLNKKGKGNACAFDNSLGYNVFYIWGSQPPLLIILDLGAGCEAIKQNKKKGVKATTKGVDPNEIQ
jgi:hypothetical protein